MRTNVRLDVDVTRVANAASDDEDDADDDDVVDDGANRDVDDECLRECLWRECFDLALGPVQNAAHARHGSVTSLIQEQYCG